MNEHEDDCLRDPNFLSSLMYNIVLSQVRRATQFLTQHEKASLFKEVLTDTLKVVK